MAKLAELYTELTARDAGLQSKLGAVRGELTGLGGSLAKMGPMIAAAFAAIAGSRVIGAVVSATMEAEDAIVGLESALKSSANAGGVTSAMLQQLAKNLASNTTHSDEAVMSAMTLALNYGVAAERMGPLMRSAIGLSRAIGTDLPSAMRYAVMAENGEYEALGRLLPQLRGLTDEGERAARVQQLMTAGWEQEQAAQSTTSGKWGELKKSLDELAEAIGGLVSGPMKDWLDRLTLVTNAIAGVIEKNKEMGKSLLWMAPGVKLIGYIFDKVYGQQEDFFAGMDKDLQRRFPEAFNPNVEAPKKGTKKSDAFKITIDPKAELLLSESRGGGFTGIADLAKQLQLNAFDQEQRRREQEKLALMKQQAQSLKTVEEFLTRSGSASGPVVITP